MMTDIGAMVGVADLMLPGIVIGIVGMAMAIINYPIYNKMLAYRVMQFTFSLTTTSLFQTYVIG